MKKPVASKKPVTKKKALKVDFTGVETRVLLPEGQYHAKVAEAPTVEDGTQAQYLKWTFVTMDDDKKLNNQKLYYNTSFAPQALWNLRNLLQTLGVETPDSEFELDPDAYVGLELLLTVTHEEYDGKMKPRVSDFMPLEETAEAVPDKEEEEEVEEADEEEEEAEEEEEVEEEVEEEEEETVAVDPEEVKLMDAEALADLIKTHKLKVNIAGLEKKPKKRASLVIDALEKAGLLAE